MSLNELIENFLLNAKTIDNELFPFIANKKNFNKIKDVVYYSGPYWDDSEIKEIIHCVLKGKWLTSGEKVAKFEKEFSNKFNKKYSLMVNSGSSANLVMIAALKKYHNWKDGDEIIVSTVGFPTTIAPIVQNNLKPIFVDITWDDLNWDLNQIPEKISNKTRAVFSSPVLGNPFDYDKLLEICKNHEIHLIADNCDSLGSKWKDQFLDIVSNLEGTSLNVGLWNTELQDPNEIISIWSHPNIESMSKHWEELGKNKEWINFNAYQENSVKYEESILLRPSICSPLK